MIQFDSYFSNGLVQPPTRLPGDLFRFWELVHPLKLTAGTQKCGKMEDDVPFQTDDFQVMESCIITTLWLFRVCRGDFILPSYMGIIINHYLAGPKSRGCSESFIHNHVSSFMNPHSLLRGHGKSSIFDGIYQERWGFSWVMLVSGRVIIIRIPMKQPVLPPYNSTCNRWIWRLAWKKLSKPGSSDFRSHGSHGRHEVRGHPVFFLMAENVCMILYI